MAIGYRPQNADKSGALEVSYNQNNAYFTRVNIGLPWGDVVAECNQSTSHWPYSDIQYPPSEGDPSLYPPVYYDLWYKFTAGSPNSTVPSGMVGITVWNMGGATRVNVPGAPANRYPGHAAAPTVTVYDANDNVIVTGRRVQFYAGDPGAYQAHSIQYYIKVTTPVPNPNDIPQCTMKIHFYPQIGAGRFVRGSIMIQDEDIARPIPAMGGSARFHQFVGTSGPKFNPNTGLPIENSYSTYGGGAGDVLPNGVTCIMNTGQGGISIWDRYYQNYANLPAGATTVGGLITVPTGTVYVIRRNGDATNFWISYRAVGTDAPTVRSLATDGTLGPVQSIPAVVSRLCARANEVLYYNAEGEYSVRVWNIITNTPLKVLVEPPSPSIGFINDIAVLASGNLLVTYTDTSFITVRRIDGVTGAVLMEYKFPTVDIYGIRAVYGIDLDTFWIRTHETLNTSTYRCIRIADGIVTSVITTQDFAHGVFMNETLLYNADNTPFYHPQLFGGSGKWNFWISPTAGVAPTGPPPDDEFYPPIVFPPYPFPPPETPPGGGGETPPPVPPVQIGGGLIVIDPDNTTRHDVYLDNFGLEVRSTIMPVIRTAFLGN